MPRSYKDEGIILKRKNLHEADRLVTILTKNHGKLVVLAKGIRNIKSSRSAHLELFNYCQIVLTRGKTWDIVTEARSLETFPLLKEHLDKIAYSYLITEIIDTLCPEKERHSEILFNLQKTFQVLNDNTRSTEEVIEEFIVQTLWNLGYLPNNTTLKGSNLTDFLSAVMEKHPKSENFLTKVLNKI